MSTRSDYTEDEWAAIRRTPAEAAIAMEQASPSGFLGSRRERKAQQRAFADAIASYAGIGLVDAIVAALTGKDKLRLQRRVWNLLNKGGWNVAWKSSTMTNGTTSFMQQSK